MLRLVEGAFSNAVEKKNEPFGGGRSSDASETLQAARVKDFSGREVAGGFVQMIEQRDDIRNAPTARSADRRTG
jgi:hypothetical protein